MINKLPIPTEYDDCLVLVDYLELLKKQGRVLNFSHTASETYTTSWKQKTKNKEMGVRKGLPDFVIVTKKAVVFIEMKRIKGGRTSPEQMDWLIAIKKAKGNCEICFGCEDAKTYLNKFI